VLAFAAIYLIWGSTYLAIRFTNETIPPVLMTSVRSLLAGGLIFAVARASGARMPTPQQARSGVLVGGLLLGGTALVAWSEQTVPSGLAALMISTVPLWISFLDWVRPGGHAPDLLATVGLLIGFTGIALLIGPEALTSGFSSASVIGMLVLVVAALSWSSGSLLSHSKVVAMPESPLMATALEMLGGSIVLGIASVLMGEPTHFDIAKVSAASLIGLAYLTIFGSAIAFSAYIWLLQVTAPTRVATYAYVNPIVAVLLGWLVLKEIPTPNMMIAAPMIIGAVVLITLPRRKARPVEVVEVAPETG
jgi:drug/metabolite transporter (DMT)-like permease